MRRLCLLVVAIVELGACGGGEPGMSPSDHLALETAIQAASAEVNRHYAAIDRATSLDDVAAESARHDATMAADLADVRARLRALAACPSAPEPAMEGLVARAESILAGHDDEMGTVQSMEAARDEAKTYADSVGSVLHEIKVRWNLLSC